MIDKNDENLQIFIDESLEHIADIESELLAIEEQGENIDEETVNKVYRAAHSIKGGSGFMGLINIMAITHEMENILGKFRNRELIPESSIIDPLLMAADMLRNLINNAEESNSYDISAPMEALAAVKERDSKKVEPEDAPDPDTDTDSKPVRIEFPDGSSRFEFPSETLDHYTGAGKLIYLVTLDGFNGPTGKDDLKNTLESMQQCGSVLSCSPGRENLFERLDQSPEENFTITLIYATILAPEDLDVLLKPTPHTIHEYRDSQGLSPVGANLETPPDQDSRIENEPSPETPHPSADTIEPPPGKPVEKTGKASKDQEPATSDQPPSEPKEAAGRPNADSSKSLRVNIDLLDSLMQLAGELVLSRNQLIRAISRDERRRLEISGQRIDHITSDLQEAIMRTRMQSISNVFNKFPRVVRDIAQDLDKKIELAIEGKEVELDKSIIENLNDPLTHIIRNAADHGIESPDVRRLLGKDPAGKITLRAYHEAGQVNIEISDNGKGMDAVKIAETAIQKRLITEEDALGLSIREKLELIFLPGFSTSESVTELSGRGVGMDVVKTNLERIGGIIDVDSIQGHGTTIRIKLPLTLAIMPSLLISNGDARYAVPQANVLELVRISHAKVIDKIEYAGHAEVIRLRDRLLPLLRLSTFLNSCNGAGRAQGVPHTGRLRSRDIDPTLPALKDEKTGKKPLNIAVVSTGAFKFGMVVDQLLDTEEIVVKPLGRHLKECKGYTGATILGDGQVALILDISELARLSGLASIQDETFELEQHQSKRRQAGDVQTLLLFSNGGREQFAVDLQIVERIQKIQGRDIEYAGGRRCIAYRDTTMMLFDIADTANVDSFKEQGEALMIIFYVAGIDVGLLAVPPIDSIESQHRIDASGFKQPGIAGSAIVNGKPVLVVDVFELVETLHPEWFVEKQITGRQGAILLAEDTKLFRNQMKCAMEKEGYRVIETEDGASAWNCLNSKHEEISLVVTDLEMPNIDGFELARKIRQDSRFETLPIIAVSSLEGRDDIQRGKECGVTEHQVKLNREKLIQSVRRHIS